MAMGQNRGTLVNIKIDGIYGCSSTQIWHHRCHDPWPNNICCMSTLSMSALFYMVFSRIASPASFGENQVSLEVELKLAPDYYAKWWKDVGKPKVNQLGSLKLPP